MTEATVNATDSQTVLRALEGALAAMGVVGDFRAFKVLYLVLTTRVLSKMVSAIIKGPSASGKSFAIKMVLMFFPEEVLRRVNCNVTESNYLLE